MRLGAAQLRVMCSVMLMMLHDLRKSCRVPIILFYCKCANRLSYTYLPTYLQCCFVDDDERRFFVGSVETDSN